MGMGLRGVSNSTDGRATATTRTVYAQSSDLASCTAPITASYF